MSANPAEWLMAWATLASLAFLGVQSYFIRESLDDPFEANLQERQIEVCSRVIKEYGAYQARVSTVESTHSILARVRDGEVRVASAEMPAPNVPGASTSALLPQDAVKTFLAQPETLATLSGQSSGPDPREGLLAALTELAVYADTETASKIDAVSLNMPTLPELGAFAQFLDQQPKAQLSRFEKEFAPLADLCRDTMLGKKKGLL
ncbi:hypothetical protein PGB28_09660 [Primorskyibacter aestuariivivens]|uniref:hypothetical protein n=1 Tax=Primorskyibacter aestuariivivens TaxID=1888912 RepID=UPI002300E30C|nr:hypothetical protein [Primorskyibacter aestuariivivens]MDA7428725.1 hypothetical protein [Primorskyibacter aestuariivivens]